MPSEDRFVVRFGAEPPQDPLPYGRWADTLQAELLKAALALGDEIGEPGDIVWFPDRTYAGRLVAEKGVPDLLNAASQMARDANGLYATTATPCFAHASMSACSMPRSPR